MNIDQDPDRTATYHRWLVTALIGIVFAYLSVFLLAPILKRTLYLSDSLDGDKVMMLFGLYMHQGMSLVAIGIASNFCTADYTSGRFLGMSGWRNSFILDALVAETIALPVIVILTLAAFQYAGQVGMEVRPPELFRALREPDRLIFAATLFAAVVLAPVSEELVFRNVVFNFMKEVGGAGTAASAVGASLIFAFMHASIISSPGLFALGITLQLLYIWRKSLLPCIVLHCLHNGIVCIFS